MCSVKLKLWYDHKSYNNIYKNKKEVINCEQIEMLSSKTKLSGRFVFVCKRIYVCISVFKDPSWFSSFTPKAYLTH